MANTAPSRTEAIKELVAAVLPHRDPNALVALVNMPLSSIDFPSIQLGLLKATLAQHGIPATVHYFNMPFAKLVEYTPYRILANARYVLLGEWLFSQGAFGPRGDDAQFLREFSPTIANVLKETGWTEQHLLDIKRSLAPEYIEACLMAVPWDTYSVVGFTSTFQQNTASFALARLLKEQYPQIKVVMGGANFDGEMGAEYVRAFPWIDYAVIGEGDVVFPELVKELLSKEDVRPRLGLAMRSDAQVLFRGPAPITTDLTNSPVPDYDEFFETGERLRLFSEWEAQERFGYLSRVHGDVGGEKRTIAPFVVSTDCVWSSEPSLNNRF